MSKLVLNGHVSPETAYIIESYPYGRLRCQMKCWVETATKGAKKGEQRYVTQTSNPKRDNLVWNKPHFGTYSTMIIMYKNTDNDHIKIAGIHSYGDGAERFFVNQYEFFNQLDSAGQVRFNEAKNLSQAVNRTSWKEWEERYSKIKTKLSKTGDEQNLHERLYIWLTTTDYHILSPELQCCEFARHHPCVCTASRYCPIHELVCIGSHD